MLDDDAIAIGQFTDGGFVEWTAARGDVVERLRKELLALDREPEIGEIAWLARRKREDVALTAALTDAVG